MSSLSPDFFSNDKLFIIAGPCVIESRDVMMRTAEKLAKISRNQEIPLIFKSSFDKANRTSLDSYRGPGLEEGLAILEEIGERHELPLLTDIHHPEQAAPTAEIVDALQVPAFLSRQTDLLVAAGKTGLPVNVKKGQFLDPESAGHSVDKVLQVSDFPEHMITERGNFFGYNRWVVDMRNLVALRDENISVVYDATHSIQLPGGKGGASGGQRQYIFPQARAAAAVGIDGVFIETHPQPSGARCDADNMLPLDHVSKILTELSKIHRQVEPYRDELLIKE